MNKGFAIIEVLVISAVVVFAGILLNNKIDNLPQPALGAPDSTATLNLEPATTTPDRLDTSHSYNVGSTSSYYHQLFVSRASTTVISVSDGSATTTISSATSTFANGIILSDGCLVVSGNCFAGSDGFSPFAWTPTADGNSTSTTLIFGQGFISQASSTVSGDFHVDGAISASSSLSVAGVAKLDSGLLVNGSLVTDFVGDSTISLVSGNLRVVDLVCTNCIGETEISDVYIVNNAADSTTGLLTLDVGYLSSASSTVSGDFHTDGAISASSSLSVADIAKFDSGILVGGDTITDFTGTNLSVTAGVLSASGGGSTASTTDWTLLTRLVTTIATTSIRIDNIPEREHLQVIFYAPDTSSGGGPEMMFNSDDFSVYGTAVSFLKAAAETYVDTADTVNGFQFGTNRAGASGLYFVADIINTRESEKGVLMDIAWTGSGADATDGEHLAGTWENTTEVIDSIQVWFGPVETQTFNASTTFSIYGGPVVGSPF